MAEDLVNFIGLEDIPDLVKRTNAAGGEAQNRLADIVIETGMNIFNTMKTSVIRGKGSSRGRVYEWEADLPGRKGDGGPLFVMHKFDRALFNSAQRAGYTPALIMPDNSGGHVIPIKLRSRPHQASGPGSTPRTDTGMLARKMDWEPKQYPKQSGEKLSVTVGVADLDYAVYLEEGTGFMKPRPFLAPAVDQEAKVMYRSLREFLEGLD